MMTVGLERGRNGSANSNWATERGNARASSGPFCNVRITSEQSLSGAASC